MNRKARALLLNAFILPGAGQLYIGRKVMGIVIIMLVNLLLLLALFVLLKGASPLIAASMISGATGTTEAMAALDGMAGFGRAILVAFILLWGFALVDVIKNGDAG